MTKYITIMEVGNEECPNVGTITTANLNKGFKEAIESHFDAKLLSYRIMNNEEYLDDCIDAFPIEVKVTIDNAGDHIDYIVELSQTWLYL